MPNKNKITPDDINTLISAFIEVFVTKEELKQQSKFLTSQINLAKKEIINKLATAINISIIPTLENHEARIKSLESLSQT